MKPSPAKVVSENKAEETKTIEALGRYWNWPTEDTECWPVIFDWSSDLNLVYQLMTQFKYSFRTVVQAGGNMGVWPWLLAAEFGIVHTFEPDPRCFSFGVENTKSYRNILWYQAALFDSTRPKIQMMNDPAEITNLGAQYVSERRAGIASLCIDDLELLDCDLIYLDIEGAEYHALSGAYETIRRNRPVIVVEDKGLSTRYGIEKGTIEKELGQRFGYHVAARFHRDVVLISNRRKS